MKAIRISLALLLVTIGAGCSNIERSRNLADPAVPGKVLAVQVCSICHGLDGNAVSPNFPRLAGQQPAYIESQLKNFKAHDRSDPPGERYMWGISRKLTDEQIHQIAEYFSQQTPKRHAVGDAKLIAAGKLIYENGIPVECFPGQRGPAGYTHAASHARNNR
jgi:cytochrome c553